MKHYEKITVAEMQVPPLKGGTGEFEVGVMEPGIVRAVSYKLTPRLLASTSRGQPEFDASLSVFVEISPGAPIRNRRFVVMREGQSMVAVEGYERVYCGTAILHQLGDVSHVYELRKVAS